MAEGERSRANNNQASLASLSLLLWPGEAKASLSLFLSPAEVGKGGKGSFFKGTKSGGTALSKLTAEGRKHLSSRGEEKSSFINFRRALK